MVLVRELVHRQQFHRRHAQLHQVLDRRRVRQPGVRAPQFLRDAGVQLREAAYVQLVDDRVRPGRLRAAVVRPLVVGRVVVDDDTLGDVRSGVPVVAHGVRDLLLGPVAHMPVHLGRQREVAVHGTGVRIEEQLRRVPAGAGPRVPAAVHPEAVPLPGPHAGHEAVPDLVGQLGEGNPDLGLLATGPLGPVRLVEEAQLDRLGAARPQREVGARHTVGPGPEARPERGRRTGPHGDGRRDAADCRSARGGLRGQPAARGAPLLHCLLLGCARHLTASCGSIGTARRERRRPGRGSPSRRPPHCSAQRRARTHVSPGEAERPRASEARPHPAGTHPTSPGPLPRWDPRDARTDARAARRGRAGRRTDMGRAAGRAAGCTSHGADGMLGKPRSPEDTIRVSPDDGSKAVRPEEGLRVRVPAGRLESVKVVKSQDAQEFPVPGPDRRGRHDLAAGRPQARPGRQVLGRRGRARRPWPPGGPARDVHDVRPRTSASSATSCRRTAPRSAPE